MQKITIALILAVISLTGCSNVSRPGDLPQLFPCTISVIQDGQPLEGAFVEFHAKDGEPKYRPTAYTGADGNAVMLTYGFSGVPAGKYKVTISKLVDDDFVYRTDEAGIQVIVSSNTYRLVESRYSDPATTPHEIEITGKKMPPVSFDVGKVVRIKR
jgi:hypothetical protein